MKLYLDACCYNRPFDDQSQHRIRLEAEAVVAILGRIQRGDWEAVGSEVLNVEISRSPDLERRERVRGLVALARHFVMVDHAVAQRAGRLSSMGLHVACAEMSGAEAFLTTDGQILRWAAGHTDEVHVRVANPLTWLSEVLEQ